MIRIHCENLTYSLKHSRRRRGCRGGRSPPIRFKTSKNVENPGKKYIYMGKHPVYLGTPLAKNRHSFSEDLFFFFLDHINLGKKKNVSILKEKRKTSSHFSGKSLVPPQIILSSYGHGLKVHLRANCPTWHCQVWHVLSLSYISLSVLVDYV